VRDVWRLRGAQSDVTAAIWRNDLRLELTPGRVICVDVPNR